MKKIVVANWKQNMDSAEVKDWLEKFESLLQKEPIENVDIIVAPTFPHLQELHDLSFKVSSVLVAAQDVSLHSDGAHTGEVGVDQLKDFCDFCIVGHSERGEKRDVVAEKAIRCFENGIKPIICFVGIENAVDYSFPDVILAWEDPENISGGGEPNPKSAEEIEKGLESIILDSSTKILYGGSVNRDNVEALSKVKSLDGVLVGSASLDPEHFFEIVKAFNK